MGEPKETGAGKKPAKEATNRKVTRRPRKSPQAKAVDEMLARFRAELKANNVKMTVGDFIRLVQLQDELKTDEPKEIRVTWVEPEKEYTNVT